MVIVATVSTIAIVVSSLFATSYKASASSYNFFDTLKERCCFDGFDFWNNNDGSSNSHDYDSGNSDYSGYDSSDYSGYDSSDYSNYDSSDYGGSGSDYSGYDSSDYDSSDSYGGYHDYSDYSDYDYDSGAADVKGEFKKNDLVVDGKDNESVVIGILGDGYTSSEQGEFNSQAKEVADYIISSDPFDQMKGKMNIYSVNVNSQESGAGDSPSDRHNNYFGSCYNNGGIERLLVANDTAKVKGVAKKAIGKCDAIIVIVNDTRYGGSGGEIITTSIDSTIDETVLHEMGHTIGGLSDEYWAGQQYAKDSPNMSSSKSNPPWKDLIGKNGIGVYPHQENPSWYKPSNNCKMQYLGQDHPFCEVCRRQLLKRMKEIISKK